MVNYKEVKKIPVFISKEMAFIFTLARRHFKSHLRLDKPEDTDLSSTAIAT